MHRKRKLAFANKYQQWIMKGWKRVIWSDETKINWIKSDGKEWMWKQADEGLLKERFKEQ